MRKRIRLVGISFVLFILFSISCSSAVSGITTDRNERLTTQKIIQKPKHFNQTWHLDAGGGGSFSRIEREQYTQFFYNFTVTEESAGFVYLDFYVDEKYDPILEDGMLTNGESYFGNYTFVGEYEPDETTYMNFNFHMVIGDNTTLIYEEIIWDNYEYKQGLGGFIALGLLGSMFILVTYLSAISMRKKNLSE